MYSFLSHNLLLIFILFYLNSFNYQYFFLNIFQVRNTKNDSAKIILMVNAKLHYQKYMGAKYEF